MAERTLQQSFSRYEPWSFRLKLGMSVRNGGVRVHA